MHPFLDFPTPIVVAHRGASGDAPENTLEAFAAAVEQGCRYLETDVHVTTDGVVVAFHDHRLDRATDRFVDAAHRAGLPVQVWTVDDVPTMNYLLDIGADAIMTNRPRVLYDVLTVRAAGAART